MDLALSALALSWKKKVIQQAGAGKHLISTELIHSLTHKNNYPYDLFHFEEDSLLQRAVSSVSECFQQQSGFLCSDRSTQPSSGLGLW